MLSCLETFKTWKKAHHPMRSPVMTAILSSSNTVKLVVLAPASIVFVGNYNQIYKHWTRIYSQDAI